jgi:hypothetical protein
VNVVVVVEGFVALVRRPARASRRPDKSSAARSHGSTPHHLALAFPYPAIWLPSAMPSGVSWLRIITSIANPLGSAGLKINRAVPGRHVAFFAHVGGFVFGVLVAIVLTRAGRITSGSECTDGKGGVDALEDSCGARSPRASGHRPSRWRASRSCCPRLRSPTPSGGDHENQATPLQAPRRATVRGLRCTLPRPVTQTNSRVDSGTGCGAAEFSSDERLPPSRSWKLKVCRISSLGVLSRPGRSWQLLN